MSPIENSASYHILEDMILHNQLQMDFSEFETFVEFLKREGLITTIEQQSLLELAPRLHMDRGV